MKTRPMPVPSFHPPRLRSAALTVAALVLLAGSVFAQPEEKEDDAPALDPQVMAAIAAPYLKPAEAAALRVKHGIPTADDITAPAARAAYALQRGSYTDASFADPAANPLDRAEAALARGDLAIVESSLGSDGSIRALRILSQLRLTQGKAPEAIAAAHKAIEQLTAGKLTEADDLVDAALCAAMLSRCVDTAASSGGDHQAMMAVLAKARELDPFSWRAPLAEAQLLLEKDNYAEARTAALAALAHNPVCVQAYTLLGVMAVNSYNLDSARTIADRLDKLASMKPMDADDLDLILADAPASLEAGFIRARASLRQNDPEDAANELAYAAKRMPDAPLLAEMRCAIAAASYDNAALDAALKSYADRYGNNPAAEARVGQTFSDLRQYAQAIEHLQRAKALAPFWPAPQIDLGLVMVQAARDDDARTVLQAATKLDPFNVRAANSLKLVQEIGSYTRTETPHFIVRAKPGIDSLLAAEIAKVMEENHAVVTSDKPGSLNYSPPGKTFIDLMPDHQWFAVRIAGMPRIHTIAASTGPVIAMEAPREGRNHTGLYDWPRVLRHEYTHTVGLSRTSNRMPHWFTEAQAQFLEHAPRDFNTAKLLCDSFEADALFDFTSINTAFTRPKKPTDRQLAYAQGQWMYEYMVERFGATAPLTLMDLFARGIREEAAVQQTFHISREQFLTDFKAWARQHLIAWGMVLPDGEPTLDALIKDLPKPEGGETATPTAEQIAAWVKEHPANPDILRLQLQSIMDDRHGELDVTELPLLQRYAQLRPVDPFPHQQLVRIFLAQNNPLEAIPHLQWLDERQTTTPVYATQLAGLFAQAAQWDKAAVYAERAARIAPYSASARELAATIAVQTRDYATARRHIEFLAALEPDRDVHKKRLEALKKMETSANP